jgi:predicted O-methyltransferase YrrM
MVRTVYQVLAPGSLIIATNVVAPASTASAAAN